MDTFVALLRAVNVGGTGKLLMEDLRALCAAAAVCAAVCAVKNCRADREKR